VRPLALPVKIQVPVAVVTDEKGRPLRAIAEDLKKVDTAAKGTRRSLSDTERMLQSVQRNAASFLGLGAAAGAIWKLADSIRAFASYGSQFSDLSARIGASAESLQKLSYAGQLTGVSLETMTSALGVMQRTLSTTPEKFAALGLAVDTLRGLEPDQQLAAIGDALKGISDPADRAAAAMSVLGRGGAAALPLLTSDLSEAADEAERLGLVMDSEAVAAADRLDDGLTKLGGVLDASKRSAGGVVAELFGVADAVDLLTAALGRMNAAGSKGAASRIFGDATGGGALAKPFGGLPFGAGAAGPAGAVAQGVDQLRRLLALGASWTAAGDAPKVNAYGSSIFEAPGADGTSAGMADFMLDQAEKSAKAQAAIDRQTNAEHLRAMQERMEANSDAVEKEIAAARKLRDAQVGAAWDAAQRQADAARARGEAAEAAILKEIELEQELFAWKERQAEIDAALAKQRTVDRWAGMADAIGGAASLLESFGVSAESALGSITNLAAGTADMIAQAAQRGYLTIGDLANQAAAIFKSGSALGGAVSGGMTGAAVGGPVGAVIGAAVGGLLGLFGGGKKKAEELRKRQQEAMDSFGKLFDEWKQARTELAGQGADAVNSLIEGLFDEEGAFVEGLTSASNAASYVAASFEMLRRSGMSTAQALERLKPALDKIRSDPQFAGGAADPLISMANAAEAHAAALDFTAQLGVMANALAGFGLLTQDLATKMSLDMGGAIQAMIDAGVPYEQALALNAQALYDLQQAAQQSGVALDGHTQQLIDDAENAGLFEGLEDPMKKLVELNGAMVAAMGELVKLMGGTLPAAIQKLVDEFNRAQVAAPTGGGPTGDTPEGPPVPGGGPDRFTAAKGFGPRLLKRDTVFQAHAGEHVLIVPKGQPVGFISAAKGYGEDRERQRGGGGGGGGGNFPGPAPTPTPLPTPTPTPAETAEIQETRRAVRRVEAAVAEIARTPRAQVAVAPQVTVQMDPSLIRRNRQEFFADAEEAIAAGIRQGTSPVLYELRQKGIAG